MSANVPVYIREVTIKDYKCFKGDHKFSFANNDGEWCQWTVFLGNNNTGKTNLLKAIASMQPEETAAEPTNGVLKGKEQTIKNPSSNNYSQIKLRLLEFPRFNIEIIFDQQSESLKYVGVHRLWDSLSIFGYGVVRDIETKGISTDMKPSSNAGNLFNHSKLINFEDWLFQLDYAAKNNQKRAADVRDLLKGVLISDIFPEINDIRFVSDRELRNYIEFQTTDGWHKLSELGYGYQATLSWLIDFCKKLFDKYPDSENPLKEPAVLLVDELDLHLHPQWQRSLVKYLSDVFPKTQFIVTTHSPFIIQSMKDVNLYVLKRENDHTKVEHRGVGCYIGWDIEEILSEVMELGKDIQTEEYQHLSKDFDEALDDEDYPRAKAVYEELIKILHPQSEERKIMKIQLSQIAPEND